MNQERYTERVEIGRTDGAGIYLARDVQLGRDVELRVWTPVHPHDVDEAEAFMRPAQLRARLEHPGIPAVLDSGTWSEDGRYYTLQLARGTSLATLLDQPRQVWPAPPLRIVAEACRAVAHAHARGLVHNGLSAEQIIVSVGGAVYVEGWDAALAVEDNGNVDSVYSADPRTDVAALGSILIRTLRRRPVKNAAALFALAERATAPDPTMRPRNAAELLDALEGRLALDVPAGPPTPRAPGLRKAVIAIAGAVCLAAFVSAVAVALWWGSNGYVPSIGDVYREVLRNRDPDNGLAQWFEGEIGEEQLTFDPYAAGIQLAAHAIRVRDYDRARAALEGSDTASRHWEWGYLLHSANLDAFTFDPGVGMVFGIAFSPDGRWLAVSGSNRRVQLFRWPEGERVGDFDGHSGQVVQVQFTPDSASLITASDDKSIIVWDVASRRQREIFNGHSSRIWSVAQLPGGTVASSSWDPNISLWDVTTGKEKGVLPAPEGVWAMALTDSGRRLHAASYDGTFITFDVEKRWPISSRQERDNFITNLAVRSDGAEIAAAYFKPVIRLLDADGVPRHEIHGHEDAIWDVDYSPDDGRIISSSRDGTARIWDAQTREPVSVIEGHSGEVNSVALDPEGTWLLTASDDGTIKGWPARAWLAGFTPQRNQQISEVPIDLMAPIEIAADGRWAAAGLKSGDVVVWVPRGARVQHRIVPALAEPVMALALEANEGLVAAGGDEGAIAVWSSRTGAVVEEFALLEAGVTALMFSPDGSTLYAGGHDQQVRYWKLGTAEGGTLGSHHDSITTIAVSADGEVVASGSLDETVRIWRDGRIDSVLRKHQSFITALAFSPTGRYIATGGADHRIYLWQLASEDEPLALGAHNSIVKALSFSPDGARLFSGGHDGTVRVWDLATQRELLVLDDLDGWIQDVVFVPEQQSLLAVNGDGTRMVWRAFPWNRREYPGSMGDAFAERLAQIKWQRHMPRRGDERLSQPFASRQ
ncbi:MAG: WD40 repeat domain-containing serine/threonine-protein kinase [Candidatus Hydrogenedentales bacterium]